MREVLTPGARSYAPRMRDIETIDSELRLVTTLRRSARERRGPPPSIDVAARPVRGSHGLAQYAGSHLASDAPRGTTVG
jgi:hypothetical protein